MSHKAFYQALYQNDQLFRLDEAPIPVMVAPERVARPVVEEVPQEVSAELEALPVATATTEPMAEPVTVIIPEPMVIPAAIVEKVTAPAPPVAPKSVRNVPAIPPVNQKVLILVDEDLTPADHLFLEKILNAVSLNLEGVDLVNIHNSQAMEFEPLLRGKVIHHFFTFGVPFSQINLDIMMDRYHPVRFDGITFMMADSLPVIEEDKDLKKRLWGALQRIFFK
ncbi:hypothetical protein GCM10023189_29540 [Nibrella saemangeumensis]|uniref:Uncharacterized protein n=1 Tax=Nibrella saemangeumensis TaxID=1084526 RepID=A0ABP8MXX7_9BACT